MKSRARRYPAYVGSALLAVSAWACSEPAGPRATPHLALSGSTTVLVSDAFARTEAAGWGTADNGGLWRIDSDVFDSFRVADGRGLIVAPNNRPRNAVATNGYGVDVAGLVSFSIDRMPDNPNRFYTVQVYARRDDRFSDGDNYYRFRIRAFGTGKMDVRVEKNVNTVRTWLMDGERVATVWSPGQRYWIRWESIGASPSTTLHLRVWADGAAEPSTWQIDTVVDEPALDVAGTTGIRVEGPNADQVNYPITFRFDDLEYIGRN